VFYIVIFSGIACGISFPQFEIYKPSIPYLVASLLFLSFFEIEVKWHKIIRRELLITVPLSTLLMPLLYYDVLSKDLNQPYRIGLLLVAIAPSGLMTLVLSPYILYKDYNLILSNFLFTTFGSILYIPFIVKWLIGTTVQINITHLFLQTAAMILIPYSLSVITTKVLSQNGITIIKRLSQTVIPTVLFIIIAASISRTTQEIMWDQTLLKLAPLVLSITIVQGGFAYLAGLILWNKNIRNTLAIVASSRNVQIMLGIAIINFPPKVVIPCVLGIIFQHMNNAIWLWLFRR
jgi:predicted Na+-dependent transporter